MCYKIFVESGVKMEILFIVVPIFIGCVFIFTIAMMVSPKLRGKMMSRQLKATKYMLDESIDDLTDIATTSSNAFIKASKNILDNNEDILKDMSRKRANINKEGIEITTRAIKKGLTETKKYCKYCGKDIDIDSKFCSFCGKEQ